MTVAMSTKKPKKPKAPTLIPNELIDQLLAQVEGKDAESILGELGCHRRRCRSGAGRVCRERLGPQISDLLAMWRRQWEQVIPFFGYPS